MYKKMGKEIIQFGNTETEKKSLTAIKILFFK